MSESLPATGPSQSPVDRAAFSLVWLRALDPRIITPLTWEKGRYSSITLESPDKTIHVKVARCISHYVDGAIGLQDEIFRNYSNDGAQFNFEFGPAPERKLVKYNPDPAAPAHMRETIEDLSRLVTIAGATIHAYNFDQGEDSNFRSDGSSWIDQRTGVPLAPLPEITLGPSQIESR